MIIGKLSNLSGYNMSDVESMIYIAYNSKLRVSYILYAGILISSLGAVMDVSVSIVAAMTEIHQKAPDLIAKDLFMSGMHVGHDMMGTMSNTLILAYTGIYNYCCFENKAFFIRFSVSREGTLPLSFRKMYKLIS